MAIQQGQCTVFKKNCLSALENFAVGTPYVYKIALYTSFATIGPNTLTYSETTDNEVPDGSGYTAGGEILTVIPPAFDDQTETAYLSFANVIWNPASFTAAGALIYNSTTGAAVAVLSFGSDKTATNTFTITFPTNNSTNAIIRYSN
jgi:hypothetical protein